MRRPGQTVGARALAVSRPGRRCPPARGRGAHAVRAGSGRTSTWPRALSRRWRRGGDDARPVLVGAIAGRVRRGGGPRLFRARRGGRGDGPLGWVIGFGRWRGVLRAPARLAVVRHGVLQRRVMPRLPRQRGDGAEVAARAARHGAAAWGSAAWAREPWRPGRVPQRHGDGGRHAQRASMAHRGPHPDHHSSLVVRRPVAAARGRSSAAAGGRPRSPIGHASRAGGAGAGRQAHGQASDPPGPDPTGWQPPAGFPAPENICSRAAYVRSAEPLRRCSRSRRRAPPALARALPPCLEPPHKETINV